VNIRQANSEDWDAIWPIFKAIVQKGDTYAYEPDTKKHEARRIWLDLPLHTYVVVDDGHIVGTYYIKANQAGPGSHVCNCGYMVSPSGRGKGFASAMCEHSQTIALELGFEAMQFNFVASTNEGAVRLWNKLGFDTVGHLPGAFNHPQQGYVDALVMYKWLA